MKLAKLVLCHLSLISVLQQKTSIEELYISPNLISIDAAKSTSSWIKSSRQTLTALGFSYIRKTCTPLIIDAIAYNDFLEFLCISLMGDEQAKELASKLQTNKGLQALHLDGSEIGSEGVSALVKESLKNHFYLEKLSLENLGKKCERALMEEKDLYLRWNKEGRCLLREENVSASPWPIVLAKTSSDCNVLFCFLQAKPDLVKKQHDQEKKIENGGKREKGKG